jgi:N-acetylglucosamine-6-phosphate deacetylase
MIKHMSTYLLVNARIISGNQEFADSSILVERGIITKIARQSDIPVLKSVPIIDAQGRTAGPGLIDMHLHGAGGVDVSEGDVQQNLIHMVDFLEARGITSFQPAMVFDMGRLVSIQQALQENNRLAQRIPGVYVEGPFLNERRRGGIPMENIEEFSRTKLDRILALKARGRPIVRTMTFAPELAGSDTILQLLAEAGVTPAWGHSEAYYEDVKNRVPCHLTHCFNAMQGFDHRKPGLALLPFLRKNQTMTFEIIADGVHINPAMLDFICLHAAENQLCLISDAMKSAGLGAGESVYLGQTVYCDGRVSRYRDTGVLIGSAMLISETAQELYAFQIASTNPARVLDMADRGILAEGKLADIVLCEEDMRISTVFPCVI